MSFSVTPHDYMDFIKRAAARIEEDREYITALDAATGDGDHWANINLGFEQLLKAEAELREMNMGAMFKKIGMIMMSKIGGSSGILYGGAYQAAGRSIGDKPAISEEELALALETMAGDMMRRGQAQPGFKTMIDALYPAAETFKQCLADGVNDITTLNRVKEAAKAGAEATRDMEAVKGRATYQANKGVGHLDPGAVTMAYQVECLCDTLLDKLQKDQAGA